MSAAYEAGIAVMSQHARVVAEVPGIVVVRWRACAWWTTPAEVADLGRRSAGRDDPWPAWCMDHLRRIGSRGGAP